MNHSNENLEQKRQTSESIIPISGMYREYFLDYASYVILERAVPNIDDGLKPVQRRILHSMKVIDDGRFHKVANIIGQTMQYHPHGDAAIGAALVKLGQKDLLIECQGNWGDIRTGDSAAAARYIEARLSKFALAVAFNPQTTEWQISYDGRKKEPISLPMKFPLVLAQGVEGIAVGLSTKILPHNFIELIKASTKILRGKKVKLYPDFLTGGSIDVNEYNQGKRGGKVKIRAKIEQVNKKTLNIKELPYGITTGSLIDSIVKANNRGKIKIKKVVDNTAKDVSIQIDLATGVSPEMTIDALYAFTNCEISASPNACVIVQNKPHFLTITELLEISTFRTKELLRLELEIKKKELEEKWHLASLEKIFIEKRIYRDIEECETWEEVLVAIDTGLRKYIATPNDGSQVSEGKLLLQREITNDDLTKLTEIKIKRISKYNTFKADERISQIEADLEQVNYNLAHLTDFAVDYFEELLKKFGAGRERRTIITSFDTIKASNVVANNAKLYANYKEGFMGTSLKKDEFVSDCSDIDDVIAFVKQGTFRVSRIADKVFMGKNILHTAVWKQGDERTTYNLIYFNAEKGRAMAKRFNVKAITRDKNYNIIFGGKISKVLYFSCNPNGESEIVQIILSPNSSAKKKLFEFDFGTIGIKGKLSQGNIVSRYPVKKINHVSTGKSSLGALKIWMDEASGRLNNAKRGKYLGEFDTGHLIIVINKNGSYELKEPQVHSKIDISSMFLVAKFSGHEIISAVYYEAQKKWTMVKRFAIETRKIDQSFKFISDTSGSKLYFASINSNPVIKFSFRKDRKKHEESLDVASFIEPKGWKALGNKLGEFKLLSVKELASKSNTESTKKLDSATKQNSDEEKKYNPGDTLELDF